MTQDAVQRAFATIVNVSTVGELRAGLSNRHRRRALLDRLREDGRALGTHAYALIDDPTTATPPASFAQDVVSGVNTALLLGPAALPADSGDRWLALLGWLASRGFGGGPAVADRGRLCRQRIRRWELERLIERGFGGLGLSAAAGHRRTSAVTAIHTLPMWRPDGVADAHAVLASWLGDEDARRALGFGPRSRVRLAALHWFIGWTAWVAAVRLVEYPAAYGLVDLPILDWIARIAKDLRATSVSAELSGH
jgi:hypothetical protein